LVAKSLPDGDIIGNLGFMVCSDCAKRLSKGVKNAGKLAERCAC
jgi:hypothetical protein